MRVGYEDLEDRLDQYWKYTVAALTGIVVFQVYRQHLIYLGSEVDAVMAMIVGLTWSLALLGTEQIYSEYFEVSGQSESPKQTE